LQVVFRPVVGLLKDIKFFPLKASFTICLLLAVFYFTGSSAQYSYYKGDARSQGMSHARVMLASQWSGLDNPAGLANLKSTTFGLCYSNYFQVPELGMAAVSCGIPTKTGNYSLSFMSMGYSLFRQSQASLSYGRQFGTKIRAGIGLHYLQINQPTGYGNLNAVIPSLGLQLIPLKWMTMGLHVYNPSRQQYIPSGYQRIPSGFQTGMGFSLGDEVLLCIEAEKSRKESPKYYGGVEITVQKKVPIRFGISSGRFAEFSFGIGFRSRKLTIDLAATRHPILGFSPAISLSCSI
jgi:hypothetical protein